MLEESKLWKVNEERHTELVYVRREGVRSVPAGVSQRLSKVGSFARNTSSSFCRQITKHEEINKPREHRGEMTVVSLRCDELTEMI